MTMPESHKLPGSDEPVPPARRSLTAPVLAIFAAIVVLVGGVAFVVTRTGDKGFPSSEYRLTEPKTLANGEYELFESLGSMVDEGYQLSSDPNFRGPHGMGGQYRAKDGGILTITGAWGQILDPDEKRNRMLRGPAEAEGTEVLVPAKDVTPSRAPVKVGCQVLAYPGTDSPSPFAMCAWADGNTTGSVELTPPGLRKPEDFDLAVMAQLTLDIRAEIRQPVSS